MKLKILAVRDRATVQFANPLFVPSVNYAVRSFTDAINDSVKDNAMYAHPDDYDLYLLGEWDSDSGMFECQVPEQVVAGKSVKRSA